ncbi:UNVERIFIED_ORG: hypothetical protein [Escherichia phage CMSTMSU]
MYIDAYMERKRTGDILHVAERKTVNVFYVSWTQYMNIMLNLLLVNTKQFMEPTQSIWSLKLNHR